MSNAARKARKRNGEKFVRTEKVGTPIVNRAIPLVRRYVRGVETLSPSRSVMRRRARQLDALSLKDE